MTTTNSWKMYLSATAANLLEQPTSIDECPICFIDDVNASKCFCSESESGTITLARSRTILTLMIQC